MSRVVDLRESTLNRQALMGHLQRGEYTKPMGFWWVIFIGGSTQNRWLLMGHLQRGEYTKPMAFDGFWNFLLLLSKN